MAQTATSNETVVLVGAGRMGGALLKGWLGSGRFARIAVVEPEPASALRDLAAQGRIRLMPAFVAGPCDAIVLAIKPQVLKGAGALLADIGRTRALVLSIAAGVPLGLLAAGLGAGTGVRLVRAMPNTPGAIGRGVTALCAGPGLGTADRALAEALTAALGRTLWLADEALMDAVTAVSGSGPAYVFLLAEALAEAGMAEGLDAETAATLARTTIAGAGALLESDSRPAAALRRDVTSPGGTTQAALDVLTAKDGLASLLRRAVAAAVKRAKELGA